MALTQITTDGIKDGTITGTDLTTNVDLVDNQKLRLGTSGNLEIYSTGTASYVEEKGTGNLRILGSNLRLADTSDNLYMFMTSGAGIEMYFNASKKFETHTGGVKLHGSDHIVNSGNFYPNSDGSLQCGLSNRKWSAINGVSLNINGGDAEFRGTTPGTTDMTWDQSENALNFDDNVYAHFGTGDDLKIYHDGSHSRIDEVGTGNLKIQSNSGVDIQKGSSEDIAKFTADGAVELYYDNVNRLATSTTGIRVESRIAGMSDDNTYVNIGTSSNDQFQFFTGGVDRLFLTGGPSDAGTVQIRGDNNKLQFGASQDLQIYHDGTNSIIKNSTGSLFINATSSEVGLKIIPNGAVELYHNDSKKLETTSYGALVTGGLDVNIGSLKILTDNYKLELGASADLQIYHDGSNSVIDNNTGNLYLQSAGSFFLQGANNENVIKYNANGAVELYYDNSKKFETTTNGIKVNNRVEVIANAIVDNAANGNNVGILFANAAILPATGSGGLTNNSKDLGSSSYRWRNIYTNDLHLSNEGGSNDVDGTWGSYTIQEGAEDLFLINKRSGKKYKFNLTEVS